FIAAANPSTVLALLDELEAKDKRIERALSLLNDANTENVWENIGRLKVVISGDYRSEAETDAAAGKGE
ncbi:ead/Ea22-like family protein, partial [Escherichia coli]|uniref:ead/Ea22-like family protein n=2 Tax=Enterobacteriaceae TaxID=543 RepID=UPI0020372036